MNGLAVSTMLLMQLTYDLAIHSLSARTLFLFASLLTYILYTYYTCDLTARMTSGPKPIAILSFRDVWDGEYRVVVQEGTSNHEYLKNAEKGSAMNEVQKVQFEHSCLRRSLCVKLHIFAQYYYGRMDGNPDYFVNSAADAWDQTLTRPKTLFFTSALRGLGKSQHTILKMTDSIYGHNGWTFEKNSEFTEFFNHHLFKLMENGLMNKLHRVCTEILRTLPTTSPNSDLISLRNGRTVRTRSSARRRRSPSATRTRRSHS